MRGFVIYVVAVVLAVLVTPWFADLLHFSGMAEIGILLVLVYVLSSAIGAIPYPSKNP